MNAYWAGRDVVVIRRVGPDRELVRSRVPAEHSAFLPKSAVRPEHVSALRSARLVTGIREDGDYWRISFRERRHATRAPDPKGWFAANGIPVLEADVNPVRRWMTDSKVEIDAPRRCYLDIETDDRVPFSEGERARILCWSIEDDEGIHVGALLERDDDDAERDLLRSLFRALGPYDQVAAWNGDRFDFVRIGQRTGRLAFPVELRRWLWIDHMAVFLKDNAHAAESGEEKQFAGLGAVARALEIEGAEKLVTLGTLGGTTTWGLWAAGGDDRARLLEYCADDAAKMRKIEAKTGYLALVNARCRSTYTLPDTSGSQATRYVEGFLLHIGARRGVRFPSRFYADDEAERDGAKKERQKFEGAFVLEPTQLGLIRDVHVLDFARLYPSVIQTWNMSPETLTEHTLVETGRPVYLSHLPPKAKPLPPGCCAAPRTDRVFLLEPEGILAEAVTEMMRLRKEWGDKKKGFPPGTPEWVEADRRDAAYKIATNSFFGVIGSPFSRFFLRDVAEAIAQGGRWLIEETMRAVQRKGWKVIYSDTDSAFVTGPTKAEFEAFAAELNSDLYPGLVAAKGCKRNAIKVEYEKAFRVLVMFGKKQYVGAWAHYKGKLAEEGSRPEIKGLAYKRGDYVRLARAMQREVIELLLAEKTDEAEHVSIVERYRKLVLEGELERGDVVLGKRLSKPLREYVVKIKKDGERAKQAPHVEVARMLAKQGADVGQGVRIEYYVADASGEKAVYVPAHGWDPRGQTYDRHYLWETLVYPATFRVLQIVFPLGGWARWERTRPPKPRIAAEGTGELFAGAKVRDVPVTVARKGAKKGSSTVRATQATLPGLLPPPSPVLAPGDPDPDPDGDIPF